MFVNLNLSRRQRARLRGIRSVHPRSEVANHQIVGKSYGTNTRCSVQFVEFREVASMKSIFAEQFPQITFYTVLLPRSVHITKTLHSISYAKNMSPSVEASVDVST